MVIKIKVVRQKRKSMQIKIEKDLNVTVKVPLNASKYSVDEFIDGHRKWIEDNIKKQKSMNDSIVPFTKTEIEQMKKKALEIIPGVVSSYAKIMGVKYSSLEIKSLKSKWGSCTNTGKIIINMRLMAAPENILEYVVVHELAHRKVMNHSSEFYKVVERYKPDYRECKKFLKTEGFRIINSF